MSYILQQARSNRLCLTNLLSHFGGKAWKIPVTLHTKPHVVLLAELLRVEAQTGNRESTTWTFLLVRP